MWLPGQDVPQWLDIGRRGDSRSAPDHLSLYILEVYPHLPLKQEIDRHGWTQASDDGAAEMYESAMAMLDARRVRAIRDFERVPAGPRVAAQPEVLDRWRLAGLRAGRALDVAGACGGATSRRRRTTSGQIVAGRRSSAERRELSRRRAARRCAVYGTSPDAAASTSNILSKRYGIDVWSDLATGWRRISMPASC